MGVDKSLWKNDIFCGLPKKDENMSHKKLF
jgi:hypothetical protein